MDRQASAMTAERWTQLKGIFEAAQRVPPAERPEIVRALAQGDKELEFAVRDLLAADESAGNFLQTPAAHLHPPALSPGARLGPYHVLGLLGEGGMGKVYHGLDTRLGRAVAIKISSEQFSKRFEHEARAISALNHPNICTLYDVGPNYLITELVEGETLRDWLQHTPALEHRLGTMRQVLEALRAAHCAGIVHRDLKPQNIMVRFDGYVKVLDFGLAKQMPVARSVQRETEATADKSLPGQIIGTVAYMSPEQIQGRPVDQRSDLFALGIILWEMLTGQHPWPRESSVDTLHAILHDDPPPLNAAAPLDAKLGLIVRKLLAKNPAERYPLAEAVLEDLSRCTAVQGAPPASVTAEKQKTDSPAPRKWILAFAILLLFAAGAAAYLFFSRSKHVLAEKGTVVLADFSNATGDPVFDDTLKQGLSVQLEQSPFLDLVSERRVNETLKRMGRAAGDRLTPEITREVCQRTASNAMVTGSIAPLGTQYVIGLKAMTCATGDMVAEVQEQAASKEDVLKALGHAAVSLRSKLGESLSSVQRYATPVEDATTSSLEALKAYSLGRKMFFANGNTASLPYLKRAVELDPNFAIAYRALGAVYGNLSQPERWKENIRKAYELREKVSERERFYIEANYYWAVTGELDKAVAAYELWRETYPRDYALYTHLGIIYRQLGSPEKALEATREAVRLEPNSVDNHEELATNYIFLNRPDEAQAVLRQAEERGLESEYLNAIGYQLAFVKGDTAQMARLVTGAMGKPGTEDLMLSLQADTQAWYGRLRAADKFTRQAVDSARRNDAQETAAAYQVQAALREATSGNRQQARADADAALKLASNTYVQAIAAMSLATVGDLAAAEKLAAQLDRSASLNTMVQRYWLPAIRAAVALQHNDPERAIERLQVSNGMELSEYPNLLPDYFRGQAYLMLHDGNRAAAEFQKFIDHRGPVMNQPLGALAHLQLGRALVLSGDKTRAKAAYQDFLTLWKDADPDIPVLKQAQAEYANLQ